MLVFWFVVDLIYSVVVSAIQDGIFFDKIKKGNDDMVIEAGCLKVGYKLDLNLEHMESLFQIINIKF